MELKVKGTVLLDYVRLIRDNKDKDWDKYLTDEDWEIINRRVLPSLWYPVESVTRCGKAVFYEIAGGDLNTVKQFGKFNADTLFSKGTYKSTLDMVIQKGGGVAEFIERYANMSPTFSNFIKHSVEKISEKHLKFHVDLDKKLGDVLEPFSFQLAGTIERLAELAGGKNVKVDVKVDTEADPPTADFDVTWE